MQLEGYLTHPSSRVLGMTDSLLLAMNPHGGLLFLMSEELGKTNKSILKTKTRKIGHISLASPFAFASFD